MKPQRTADLSLFLTVTGLLLASLAFVYTASAQTSPVPNPSFEQWTITPDKDTLPTGWFGDGIFRSLDAHTGSFAVGGKVRETDDSIFGAIVSTGTDAAPGFPINYRPLSLEGFYKFTSVGGDSIHFVVTLKAKGMEIGWAMWRDSATVTGYKHFAAPIYYKHSTKVTPDTASVGFTIINENDGEHAGSTFIVDDIALTMNVAPPQILLLEVNDGESKVQSGDSTSIVWSTAGPLTSPIDLDVSLDGQKTWTKIFHGLDPLMQLYDWRVPNVAVSGVPNVTISGVMVRVTSGSTTAYSKPFNIVSGPR